MAAPLELPQSVVRSLLGAAADAGRFAVVGLDAESRVVGLFPNGSLLGYSADELHGWYLAEALGVDIEEGFRFIRRKNGEQTAVSVSLRSLPADAAGFDPSVRRLAVIAE